MTLTLHQPNQREFNEKTHKRQVTNHKAAESRGSLTRSSVVYHDVIGFRDFKD